MSENIREEETFDRRMAENTEQTNHPWNILATVSSFDRGNRSTLCLNSVSENPDNEQISQVTPSTSFLIGSLVQQLCVLYEQDKERRKKLYFAICTKLHELGLIDNSFRILELDAIRLKYQQALSNWITQHIPRNALNVASRLTADWNRYEQEFSEICFIASGGFGKVYKALHRLDGSEYAIKKIVVPSSHVETIIQHLKEVKTLAKLNHANIVPYKAAWIQSILLSSLTSSKDRGSHELHTSGLIIESESDNSQSNSNSYSNKSNPNLSDDNKQNIYFDNEASGTNSMCTNIEQQNTACRGNSHFIADHDSIYNRFHDLNSLINIEQQKLENSNFQKCIEEDNSDIVSFRNSSKTGDQTEDETNYTDHSDHSDSCEESDSCLKLCTYTSNRTQLYWTLYIQMALCEQTLEQWMRNRINTTPESIIITVLQQIICGIDYIHSQGIVHHDIKPSNIFISTSGQLQIHIGDFGLACPLRRENHHSVIGTHMYAAPEQLQGKCDRKSDIYSVGIVLIELLIRMQTHMELSYIINSFKSGNIPESLTIEQHKWAQLIMELIEEDPAKRPCTNQLLQYLKDDKDITIAELRSNLRDKDSMIQELQEEIALLKKLKVPLKDTVTDRHITIDVDA